MWELLCLHTLRADCNSTFPAFNAVSVSLPPHAPCRLQLSSTAFCLRRQALPPHAPCRLQQFEDEFFYCQECFASTRSVQIATAHQRGGSCYRTALPPHAPCRLQQAPDKVYQQHRCFASTRSVQIATLFRALRRAHIVLCLHTLRADCNARKIGGHNMSTIFASTRSVQIATQWVKCGVQPMRLCLHTLRADCNKCGGPAAAVCISLPPHAPCRLQHLRPRHGPHPRPLPPHAPCRLQPAGSSGLE